MSQKTLIEWTDATWNQVTGCTKVSPGCDHCYADRLTRRFGRGTFAEVKAHSERLLDPRRRRSPQLVLTCSMEDLFHPRVSWDFVLQVFDVMATTPQHTYQVLTKRPGRMAYFAEGVLPSVGRVWPANVWAGTSVESTKYLRRVDLLKRVSASVCFVSAEPLLERLDLRPWLRAGFLDWVIAGGESGERARPTDLEWLRFLIDQCKNAGVPVFVKQLGTAWASARSSRDRDYKGGNTWNWPIDLRIPGGSIGVANDTRRQKCGKKDTRILVQ